jgi:hypothetical protein
MTRFMSAGLLVGLLDGAFAVALFSAVLRVATPSQVFQSIAAAFLGRAADGKGAAAVALGVAMHFAIGFGWVLVYALLRRRIVPLRILTLSTAGALLTGLAFGVCVWLAMDLVLVPLTRARPTPAASGVFWIMLAWHAVGVGLPPALLLRD